MQVEPNTREAIRCGVGHVHAKDGATSLMQGDADLLEEVGDLRRIRQLAATHAIPIVERKPLARLLHGTVKTGDYVPPDAYAAVAEVLAFVYRMNGRAA